MTFTASGDTTQTPFSEATEQAMTLAGCQCVQTVPLLVTTAQIMTLQTVPVFFGIVVPVGFYIHPLSAVFKATFNSVAYDVLDLYVMVDGNGGDEVYSGNYLGFTSDTFIPMTLDVAVVNQTRLVDGGDYYLVAGANPTVGDSDINVTVSYMLLATPA